MAYRAVLSGLSIAPILVLLVSLYSSSPGQGMDVAGKAHIVDGDTVDIGQVRIRIHGIDAAESGQRCVAPGQRIVRPGDLAESKLREMASAGLICSGTELDQYGRLIAKCKSKDGLDVGRTLVSEGLAWAFARYSSDYLPEETAARAAHLGIWQLSCDKPWDFRAKRWKAAEQKAPNGCPIKGNISQNGHIYHMPWDRYYAATRIDLQKGERWFCDENEAVAAGWRRALQ